MIRVMQDFEKLGVFYLGKSYDLAEKKRKDDLLLYDSRDLVTHAVCVGMTGSGKTGLCLSLIEEAAIDGVPAILIDPKGDLCNLLLAFPDLAPADFRPWINEEDAGRKGLSPDDFAKQQAETWKKGLAEWGEDGARIQKMKDAADFAIYTPGSTAGLPVSILKSFAAPEPAARDDEEILRERVASTATGLLTLLGVDADPLKSREHILVSTVLAEAWKNGEDLDLAALIARIQSPSFTRVGVVELESFFPGKDRFALAMNLNNLLAAPGFSTWLEGEPLEIGAMLRSAKGKPRVAIFSIAHLSDAERMFFVTLLLNQVLSWMRAQSGTTSLRAILYMDEIAGYFPPVATPPAKAPLLTLLKQGRAFGLGVVLATQNPVDLDYKGLANTGTWFLGRLQTERDKARVLEGLEGVAAGASQKFDRGRMEQLLAGLGNRVFLLNNVHEDAPEVFETRWALSYLRGPLTRAQIKTLMDPLKTATAKAPPAKVPSAAASAAGGAGGARPVLPPAIPQLFAPLRGSGEAVVYRAAVLGVAEAHFSDAKSGAASTRSSPGSPRSRRRSTGLRPSRRRSRSTSARRGRSRVPGLKRWRRRQGSPEATRRGARTWRPGSTASARSSFSRAGPRAPSRSRGRANRISARASARARARRGTRRPIGCARSTRRGWQRCRSAGAARSRRSPAKSRRRPRRGCRPRSRSERRCSARSSAARRSPPRPSARPRRQRGERAAR